MKPIPALVAILLGVFILRVHAEEPPPPQGVPALIEVVSWGASTYEPGDTHHVGFLAVKTIETASKTDSHAPPAQFKLSFSRAVANTSEPTPWNSLPSRSGGRLGIHNGEWIIGRFVPAGDTWEVASGDDLFALARPEDLPPERLKQVQARFSTPLIRQWLPKGDILADILDRVRWRMSEAELKKAFADSEVTEGTWNLSRSAFRKTIVLKHPNTETRFEFSGVADGSPTEPKALSSSLVSFEVIHPIQPIPDASFQRPPDGPHYQYIKQLHDACLVRLERKDPDAKNEEMFHSGVGYGYMFWEKIVSDMEGTFTFNYWTSAGHTGVVAQAPQWQIEEDVRKEKESAAQATRDWPVPIMDLSVPNRGFAW